LNTKSPMKPPLQLHRKHLIRTSKPIAAHLPFSIQIPFRASKFERTGLKKIIYIPWCTVFGAADISKTMLIRDVACATCQWIPVPCFSGGTLSKQCRNEISEQKKERTAYCRTSITKFRIERWLYKTLFRWPMGGNDRAHKLLVAWKYCPQPIYGFAS